jgi:hypothetical protein
MPQVASIKTRSLQTEELSGDSDRLINDVLLESGVVDVAGDSFKVFQNTGSDMRVSVGSGAAGDKAVIRRSGRVYIGEHDNASQLYDIAAAPSAPDSRIDLAVYRTYDDEADSSGNTYSDVEIIQGTPDGSPSPPAVPDGATALAEIEVGSDVSAITDGDITDRRAAAQLRDELAPATIKIFETVLASAAASVVVSNIPQTHRDLVIEVEARGAVAAVLEPIRLRVNGSSSTVYWFQQLRVLDATISATATAAGSETSARVATATGASANSDFFGTAIIEIPEYSATDKRILGRSESTAYPSATVSTNWSKDSYGFGFNSTAAVSSVTIFAQNGNLVAGTRVTVYLRS